MLIPIGSQVLVRSLVYKGKWALGTVRLMPSATSEYQVHTSALGLGSNGMVWRTEQELVPLPKSATSEQIQALLHIMGGSLLTSDHQPELPV